MAGQIIFAMRHGETEYTNKGLDLTPEGIKQMEEAARFLASLPTLRGGVAATVDIFSSRAPRAKGGAQIIQERLRLLPSKVSVHEVPLLDPFGRRDPEAIRRKMKEEAAKGLHPDDYYWEDDFFDNTAVVEPRSEVNARSHLFLYHYLLAPQSGLSIRVVVSHFEVITPWLNLFGFERKIGYGERLCLEVTDWVFLTFRNRIEALALRALFDKLWTF